MNKKWISLFIIFFLTGCVKNDATTPVRQYLQQFQNHEKPVLIALEELFKEEDLLNDQKEMYELIMKRQYVNLQYQIEEETYQGDNATIKVLIEVYDYHHSRKEAKKEMQEHIEDYLFENGEFDTIKYENLQLKKMNQENKRVKYTVNFNVSLQNETWTLQEPNYKIIEKIHGFSSDE